MKEHNIPAAEKRREAARRPPVVVVLGHVDHGKSSLLEAVREEFRITSKEAGGITQHLGAYEVEAPDGRKITFLDTPGHAAFSAMRSRGAKVADIALLVVAADDGVKPQTTEAIRHIREAELPFLVVATKTDKPEANAERLKQQLAQEGVLVEGFGGTVPLALVSSKTKEGIPELLELILLVADVEDLPSRAADPFSGVVVESFMDAKRGPSATVLVRQGVLRQGDPVVTRQAAGKARILEDFAGNSIREAGPSQPAFVLGWEKAPRVGEEVWAEARSFSAEAAPGEAPAPLQGGGAEAAEQVPQLKLVLKADVAGSLEALEEELRKLPQEEAKMTLVHAGVGEIGENDVKVAQGAGALILGFRSKARPEVADLAERSGVRIETFAVIYELLERAQKLLEESYEQTEERRETGEAEILALFSSKREQQVVGGMVRSGELRRGVQAELVRDGEVVGAGRVRNLQRNKEDASRILAGEEFGMLFESAVSLRRGDLLKAYEG